MKKFIILLLSAILTISSVNCTFAANTYIQSFETQYLKNGLYLAITIEVEENSPMTRGIYSKKASKIYTITNGSNEKVAEYKLKGEFLYNGSNSSSCVASSYDTIIYDSEYKFTSAVSYHSGNTAMREFICKHYLLGISIRTITKTLTLSCDKNGNIY